MSKIGSRKSLARGAALVEYALLVALIAVVSITAIQTIGDKATVKLESVAKQLSTEPR